MRPEACDRPDLVDFLTELWPSERRRIVQSEPGCAIVGSVADVAGPAATPLDWSSADPGSLPGGATATGRPATRPHVIDPNGQAAGANVACEPDWAGSGEHAGHKILNAQGARADLRSRVDRGRGSFGRRTAPCPIV